MSKELEAFYRCCAEEVSQGDYELVETTLKALDIIKKLPKEEKQVLLNTVYTYTKSEEEYDLLKKELL